MRKVNFVCPTCGGKKLLQVESGALLKSPLKELGATGGVVSVEYENDGTLIVTDENETEMFTLGYECAKCGSVPVRGDGKPCNSHVDIFRWLRGERMLGEEYDQEVTVDNASGSRS
jgi:predicted RNA-binding Zn-ribbon protein involved in translation (DUF1610 family)